MLRRVRIRGYKTLRDVDITLRPLTVLLGPNAAGKSNFLDALQLLSKLASTRTLNDAFDPPYRGKPLESFTFGTDGLKGLLALDSVSFSIEADFSVSDTIASAVERRIRDMRDGTEESEGAKSSRKHRIRERYLRYRIEVEMVPRSGILRVTDEYLAALKDDGSVNGSRRPFIERMGKRIHLRQEGQAHPKYFERYLDHSILSLQHYSPHYPHVVAAREALASWAFFYFEPRERMRAANPVRETRHIGLMGEELPAYLNTLKALEPKQFDAVERALRLILPQIEAIEVEVSDLGEVELRLVEHGVSVPARIVSEGTLRILGMLALSGARNPPSLIGFEEPENGIHPRRVELVAELLRARGRGESTQYIVTTHSPVLSNQVDGDSLLIVRQGPRGTSISPLPSAAPLLQSGEIDEALEDVHPLPPTVSERLMRGDFDG